jgi:hypothetical protein
MTLPPWKGGWEKRGCPIPGRYHLGESYAGSPLRFFCADLRRRLVIPGRRTAHRGSAPAHPAAAGGLAPPLARDGKRHLPLAGRQIV